ncbi:MAG TPA: YdiU family protein [Polyangiales bacterium]|nr:YdiU family protein [Polyangiales bacterium]
MSSPLSTLSFDNSFVRELPGDPDRTNRRRQVLGACYSQVDPTPVAAPRLVAYSREVAELVGLSPSACESQEFAEAFAGNQSLPGMQPYAACYGGHQFGNWAGQLGDGRAITLGEVAGPNGRWELQLKGAGPTPYSRTADGRAVLRSSVREFLCSEAMAHLGVPTTRALSLVTTGEKIVRDMFYDGNPEYEPGAVVCRVAPTFLRFGNYELLASRGDHETLRRLANYTIARHFPELGEPSPEAYVRWLEAVCRRTAVMVTHWMRVGFVHGVMNTDNMSVLGLTIDYGPYGWLDDFDPTWTPNTTDAHGRRYRYGQQPNVAWWNLSRFASALVPLVGATEELQAVLQREAAALATMLQDMQRQKIGLAAEAEADALAEELPSVLHACALDMTLTYRWLARLPSFAQGRPGAGEQADQSADALLKAASYEPCGDEDRVKLASWLQRYAAAAADMGMDDQTRRARMDAVNPKYVLRNYLAQLAIDRAAEGDSSLIYELLQVLRAPYAEQPEAERWAVKRPDWARQRAGCSMLSCSS